MSEWGLTDDAAEDDEPLFDPGLFVNDDYETVCYSVAGIEQPVLCSTASSTDYDLTGQVVWPVSVLLAHFVARVLRPRGDLEGARVVELGAGCGLPGLIAARAGARVTALTDGSEIVCELLARQLDAERERRAAVGTRGDGELVASLLEWGDAAAAKALISRLGAAPRCILGADVVCWEVCISPLLRTIRTLLAAASTEEASASTPEATPPRAYLGFVCRAHRTESEFLEKASAFGVSVERVRLSTFLPPHWLTPDGAALRQHADLPAEADDDGAEGALPEELRSQLRLEVLCLSLTPDGLARELEGTDGAYVRPEVVALPC